MHIKGKEQLDFFRFLQLRGALRCEIAGMKHSSGRSAYAVIKKEYNLKGSKKKVLEQMNLILQIMKEKRQNNVK